VENSKAILELQDLLVVRDCVLVFFAEDGVHLLAHLVGNFGVLVHAVNDPFRKYVRVLGIAW
jgi:hypothetical protein